MGVIHDHRMALYGWLRHSLPGLDLAGRDDGEMMNWPDDYIPEGFTPYHIEDAGIIFNCDCRDILPKLPKVDLVLTDFPYANGTNYGVYEDTQENLRDLVDLTMPHILAMERALITCGVANINLYPKPDWILCWAVPAGVGSSKWGFSCWQPILAYGKDPYLQNGKGRRPDLFIDKATQDTKGHPCPKPSQIWKNVLNRGSLNPTDVVLDPFLGSGTTAVAAKELGRRFIGIEISEEYCKIAVKRLRQGVLNFDASL